MKSEEVCQASKVGSVPLSRLQKVAGGGGKDGGEGYMDRLLRYGGTDLTQASVPPVGDQLKSIEIGAGAWTEALGQERVVTVGTSENCGRRGFASPRATWEVK